MHGILHANGKGKGKQGNFTQVSAASYVNVQ
jgi:hypothetical protein